MRPPDVRKARTAARYRKIFRQLYPALKLAQHELADHVHAGLGIVEAGDRGELLAAIVFEDLCVFLRDLLQRLQAIGGEAGRDHRDALDAVLGELFDGLVGRGLKPLR